MVQHFSLLHESKQESRIAVNCVHFNVPISIANFISINRTAKTEKNCSQKDVGSYSTVV